MLLLRNRLFPLRGARTRTEGQFPPVLFQMASAYWVSQAVYVAAKLGIADFLKSGPRPCSEIATLVGADQRSLFRIMRCLSSLGVFSHANKDSFALSPLGESLRSDIPGSLRAIIITLGEIHYQACGALLHGVQTGSPSFEKVFGTSLFEYLAHRSEDADCFNDGMSDVGAMLAYAVILAYDFGHVSSIVDVGGGNGRFLEKVLELFPEINGTVLDCASAIDEALSSGKQKSSHCSYVTGDFFVSVPTGADLYILCGVVHDWDDDRAATILRNCRQAMPATGRLLLLEAVVPENDSMHFSKILDINMMAMSSGRERTGAEFNELLTAAGFKMVKIVATMAPQSLIEAIPH
jgi:SAM-dependent methyltransferase